MYTANTMSSAFEAMGMSFHSSTMAAEDAEKRTVRNRHLFWYQQYITSCCPRKILTRKAFENAIL